MGELQITKREFELDKWIDNDDDDVFEESFYDEFDEK